MAANPDRLMRLIGFSFLITIAAVVSLYAFGSKLAPPPKPGKPHLAVLVVFDQMRGDYLKKWQKLYVQDGFNRLMKEGAWFNNCHYPYSNTVTAAGHASILTGTSPYKHGIVANGWYERAEGMDVESIESDRYQQIPPVETPKKRADGRPRDDGVSPDRLLVPGLGDSLKAATNNTGKVVGLSLKSRSAVLPTGHHADACYWLDGNDRGLFVTSTYYGKVHSWVTEINDKNQKDGRPADRWFGKKWNYLRPELNYVAYSGPDDVAGEGIGFAQGRTFPHPMDGGKKELGRDYYRALYNSPFGNDLLLELTKKAIDAEALGQTDRLDLLTVSFSCTDSVGHTWGPDSQEVLDTSLRADLIVRDLLNHLDRNVGKENYVLILTADHGVCRLPEISRSEKQDAGRLPLSQLVSLSRQFLDLHYKMSENEVNWFEAVAAPWFYLNHKAIAAKDLKVDEVAQTLAQWLETQPGIQKAYSASQIQAARPTEDPIEIAVRKSTYPTRSGDVTIILKPYWIFPMPFEGGTSHGSPHPYDTHVPFLVFGHGITAGIRDELVTPQAAAAILAEALGIPCPAAADVGVPEKLRKPVATPP